MTNFILLYSPATSTERHELLSLPLLLFELNAPALMSLSKLPPRTNHGFSGLTKLALRPYPYFRHRPLRAGYLFRSPYIKKWQWERSCIVFLFFFFLFYILYNLFYTIKEQVAMLHLRRQAPSATNCRCWRHRC